MNHFLRVRERGAPSIAPASPRRLLTLLAAVIVTVLVPLAGTVQAMKIQQVKSPGGIQAWLVEETGVPLMAMRFSFEGGNSQDLDGREGVANIMSSMLDEGAGDLDAFAYQKRMEELAMRMSFDDGRDSFYGSFETLTANRDKAVEMLRLAVNKPRFDGDAVDRIKNQVLASLAFAAKDPDRVADRAWSAAAFPGHPYGRAATGTTESVGAITGQDLESYRRRIFAKDTLKVVVVGDIDARSLGLLLDTVFGELPAKAQLTAIAKVVPKSGGQLNVVEMNVPQSVAIFGGAGLMRNDPDFIPAFVLNHIIGGGGFASRLMEEVREKRGLAYSVYSYLAPYRHSSIFAGGVATKNEEIGKSLEVIKGELVRMATEGPSATELDNAKSFLTGSYALRFDTNAKIANQLLGILQDDLGVDYVEKRNKLIDAVTLADLKRVAGRLLKTDDLIITVVGKPKGLPGRT